uniref:F-box protein AT5G49610-like beta-propeller domain-containing protein n=1 Tax=Oryza brachyantha TaxID=4533 RepID=J3L0D8_ORYBR
MALQPFKGLTAVASLTDDLLAEILLRLPSAASLARAALASKCWLGVASAPGFLRRFRARHTSSPLLGLFVSHGYSGLPVFPPAGTVRTDPDLGAAARGGDFLLTCVGGDPHWHLRDCRNGRLLLCRGRSVAVYDPVSRRRDSFRRPEDDPFSDTYVADCLLHGHGDYGAASSFRVVSVQRHGRRMRAVEFRSGTGEWSFHPWMENVRRPRRGQAMHAAGMIFWKCEENSLLLLDTRTMEFSMLPLPVSFFQPSKYAVGEMEDGVCCLVCLDGTMDNIYIQVWLLMEDGGGGTGRRWELEKEMPVSEVLDGRSLVRQVRTVAGGLVLVSWDERHPQFAIDLKNMKVTAEFMCSGPAYLFQAPWPPAVLLDTEYVEPLQLIATQDVVNHVNLAAERTGVLVNSEGPLDLILGPHGPQDTQQAMVAEGETLVATADLKLLTSAEVQNQLVAEKPEINKGLEVPVLKRNSARLVKRRGARYENVLHMAMEMKARSMGGMEQLSTSPGRNYSRSEKPTVVDSHYGRYYQHRRRPEKPIVVDRRYGIYYQRRRRPQVGQVVGRRQQQQEFRHGEIEFR